MRLHRRRSRSPRRHVAAGRGAALHDFAELNARIEDDEIVLLDRYDLGVAVDTEAGLVVPVVRGCDWRSVAEIDAEIHRLAEGARAGTLQPDELRDSTFTVTSAGKLGGLFVTPLINHPEVAILGLHRIGPRAWCATARSWCARWGTCRSRSTTASSTAPARERSAST